MPLAVETLLFSLGGMVTLKALKRSGRSVTVGNFVAATTVRVIGWAGGCCATACPPTSTARAKAEVVPRNDAWIPRDWSMLSWKRYRHAPMQQE